MNKYLIELLVASLSLTACGSTTPDKQEWVSVVRYSGGQPVEVMVLPKSQVSALECKVVVYVKDQRVTMYGNISIYPLPNYKGQESFYLKEMSNAQDL